MFSEQIERAGAMTHMLGKQHACLIRHQRRWLTAAQCIAGETHDCDQKVARIGDTQDVIESVPNPERTFARCLHRRIDQLLPTHLHPRAMTDLKTSGFGQHCNGYFLRNECLQPFTSMVPIDEEHDARPNAFQSGVQCACGRIFAVRVHAHR